MRIVGLDLGRRRIGLALSDVSGTLATPWRTIDGRGALAEVASRLAATLGGDNRGPTPYGLLLAGLGACTSMTLRLYAARKKWPLERVTVRLTHDKIHAQDCESCETTDGRIDKIDREIMMEGPLDSEQQARLLEIADKCPVHRTLHSEVVITTREATDLR